METYDDLPLITPAETIAVEPEGPTRITVPNNLVDDAVMQALDNDIQRISDKIIVKEQEVESQKLALEAIRNELAILQDNQRRKIRTKNLYAGIVEIPKKKEEKKEERKEPDKSDKWAEYQEREKEKAAKKKKPIGRPPFIPKRPLKDTKFIQWEEDTPKKKQEPIFQELEEMDRKEDKEGIEEVAEESFDNQDESYD
jgi:hypothetical protein